MNPDAARRTAGKTTTLRRLAQPWTLILIVTGLFQLFRGAPIDAAFFLGVATLLLADAVGRLRLSSPIRPRATWLLVAAIPLVVALLNSALYRALHVASRRDARQQAFPQVKIAHLRALPAPPRDPPLEAQLAALTATATANGVDRAALDTAVFDLFAVPEAHRVAVIGFLAARAPELGYRSAPGSAPDRQTPLDPVRQRLGL